MPDVSLDIVREWLQRGMMDMDAAAILLREDGPLPVVAFHIQQTIEKYLKGFLIAHGQELRRTHDLEELMQEAMALEPDFSVFLTDCQRITEYYIETRYPMGIATPLERVAVEGDLKIAHEISELVHNKTGV